MIGLWPVFNNIATIHNNMANQFSYGRKIQTYKCRTGYNCALAALTEQCNSVLLQLLPPSSTTTLALGSVVVALLEVGPYLFRSQLNARCRAQRKLCWPNWLPVSRREKRQ